MAKSILSVCSCWLAVCAISVATAQDVEEQLVGKWNGNPAKTREFLKIPAPAGDLDDDRFDELTKLSVEFSADHSVKVWEGDREPMQGEWKLVKDVDGKIEIDLIRDGESTAASIEFVDKDSIAIVVKFEEAIVFSRQSATAVDGIAAKLAGAWRFDKKATSQLDENNEFSQDQIDAMMQEAGSLTVVFRQDGTFVAMTSDGKEVPDLKGTWKSSGADKEKQSFTLSLEVERGPDSMTVELREDGSVCFSPPGEPSAVFVRKAEETKRLP